MASSAAGIAHSALLYSGAEQYVAGVEAFVRAGLAAREPVAVAVPGENHALLRTALRSDLDRIRLVDMTDVGRNPGRIIPMLHAFADDHPADRVRVVSEPVWPGRTPAEVAACMEHEALVNLAFPGRRIAVMCPYARETLTAARLTEVQTTHPVLVDSSAEYRSDRYAPADLLCCGSVLPPEPATAFTSPFTCATLPGARRTAMAYARRSGVAEHRVYGVGVAVSELATNSIKYGGGSGFLRIWTEAGAFVCEVSDRGWLDDPLAGRRPVPPTQLSGRGLLLVNMYADLVRICSNRDGTTVRFHVAIDRDGTPGDE